MYHRFLDFLQFVNAIILILLFLWFITGLQAVHGEDFTASKYEANRYQKKGVQVEHENHFVYSWNPESDELDSMGESENPLMRSSDIENQFTEPTALFLTWQYDPTTSMTIDWHTKPGDQGLRELHFKVSGGDQWDKMESFQHFFPYSKRIIHRVHLTGLEPDTKYRFRTGEFERIYSFRTMPAELHRPVRFATGGDINGESGNSPGGATYELNKVVMQYEPDFIVWGGDLAIADGQPDLIHRWYNLFDVIKETLITDEGHVIPIIVGIGNHEMKRYVGGGQWSNFEDSISPYESTYEWRSANAPYFFQLFAFPGHPGYNVMDFGNYMSLLLLDSGHANKVDEAQADWLERSLKERQRRRVPHIFPVYHVPGYPSFRRFEGTYQTQIRQTWHPLFERHGVRVSFASHELVYKRTHPIRNFEISADGVVYMGDGAWSPNPREVTNKDAWYMKVSASESHAIIVTLEGDIQKYLVVNEKGEIIDTYTDYPR